MGAEIQMPLPPEAQTLATIRRVRTVIVFVALGLLLYSFLQQGVSALAFARAAAWAVAGVLSVVEALLLRKLGQKATNAWWNAAVYLGIAFVPLLARR